MNEILKALENFFLGSGLVVAKTISLVIFGLIVARLILRFIKNMLVKSNVEKTVSSFLNSIFGLAIYFVLFLLVAKTAGLSTGSFIAVVSAAGLAIGLALKDSLSNLANGFIIVGSKPFVVGDYIDVAGVSGTVRAIGIFSTKLATPDERVIILPNSQIIGSSVVNYSTMPTRRLDMEVNVAYDTDIEKARAIILATILEAPQVLHTPSPVVWLTEYGANALKLSARVWLPNEAYWDVKFSLNEKIIKALKSNNIEIPFNKLDVNILSNGGGNNNEKA
ncbi:MAG: mechanosensitive ion channel [Clostridia bacterium]